MDQVLSGLQEVHNFIIDRCTLLIILSEGEVSLDMEGLVASQGR